MMRWLVLLSVLVALGLLLSSASAAHQRRDQYDHHTAVTKTPLDDIVSSLIDFKRGLLSPLYDFFLEAGLQEVVARLAVVMVFTVLAVAGAASVDYVIQLVTSLAEERTLPETPSLSPDNIRAALELMERAVALWE